MMYSTKKLTGARLTLEGIEKVLRGFPTDKILNISSGHGEVSSLESANDCMMWKVTSPVISQTRATGKIGVNKASEMKDPSYRMHPSIVTAHSYLAINKSSPSGRGKVNVFAKLGPNGSILEDPANVDLLENFQKLLNGNEDGS